jgi:hypothetical protein
LITIAGSFVFCFLLFVVGLCASVMSLGHFTIASWGFGFARKHAFDP